MLPRDRSVKAPTAKIDIDLEADNIFVDPAQHGVGFTGSASILAPSLVNLPAITVGVFDGLAVSLFAPRFETNRELEIGFEVILRGESIGRRVFRRANRVHQVLVPSELMFEVRNRLEIKLDDIDQAGTTELFLRIFYYSKRRLFNMMARDRVWVFSTARSGSSWLANDILCSFSRGRPIDESGLGRMFSPFDYVAERFYDLASRDRYIPSGLPYELREQKRPSSSMPVFERAFMYHKEGNKIWSQQQAHLYTSVLRDAALQHALHEWGVIWYQYLVFKMPNDSSAADILMRAFPEAFMIFLVRDGRDVMKSRFSPFASQLLARTNDRALRRYAISFYSHLWNFQIDIMTEAFNAHAEDRRLLIHYEDLRANPRAHIAEIFKRMDRPLSDENMNQLLEKVTLENLPDEAKGPDKARQSGEIGGFVDFFSREEIGLMNAIMGPKLRQFGYGPT